MNYFSKSRQTLASIVMAFFSIPIPLVLGAGLERIKYNNPGLEVDLGAGFAVMSAYTSSISYIATPGKAFDSNWHPIIFSLCILPVAWLVCKYCLSCLYCEFGFVCGRGLYRLG